MQSALASRLAYALLSPTLWLLHVGGVCGGLLARRGFERVRWGIGRLGVWVRFQSAARNVPAYHAFLAQHGVPDATAHLGIAEIPATDKKSYVHAFPLEARCEGGRLPSRGIQIDESSGSGGLPTTWVRGAGERAATARSVKRSLRGFGDDSLFFVNAYALGPWSAGIGTTLTLAPLTRVKTVGNDVVRVENALQLFGTAYHYVILGYPPFLKQVVDQADIDWKRYRVSMLYGGESITESLRRYLQQRGIRWISGTYGAADLNLSMATETKFTIALRGLLESRPDVAAQVLPQPGAMPSILQFNPAEFFIESNGDGELLVTVCRPRCVAPKVRYNIHDVGHVMRMPQLARRLNAAGVSIADLDAGALDLPVLFLYGRSDSTVTFNGAKLSPSDIQEALYHRPELSIVDGFQLHTYDDADDDQRLVVSLEVPPDAFALTPEHWARLLFDALAEVKMHFREVRKRQPAGKEPTVELFAPGTGPFAGAGTRIKRNYVKRVDA